MQPEKEDQSSDDDYVPFGFKEHIASTKKEKIVEKSDVTNKDIQKYGMPTDLQYQPLLEDAFVELRTLKESNELCKFKLPLEVRRDGANKTVLNLMELANILNRDPDHLQKYIMNELLTNGSLNQEGKLFMKGRFTKIQIQDILRGYIDVFVMCKSCFSADNTALVKDNKMIFLKCNKCGGLRHVGAIVEGYKASVKLSKSA